MLTAAQKKIISFNILMFPSTVRPQKALLSTPAGSPPEAMDADADADADAEVDENSDNCEKLARLDLNLKTPESEDQEVLALKLLNLKIKWQHDQLHNDQFIML
ncbi:hypothetical protein D5086_006598 [Populus alba]|uniref:Uncharacterized protein n=1 Tax=Populus alba TaxID=43335 RepID=A0ACC4CM90_POPAL